MQSGSAARTTSNGVTSSLSYIDTLVSGATSQGLYSVTVDGSKVTNGMISSLRSYGYTVESSFDNMGTYPRYVISW